MNIFFRDCDAFHLKQGRGYCSELLDQFGYHRECLHEYPYLGNAFQRTNLLDHFVDEKYSLLRTPLLGVRMTWEKYLYPCEFPYQTNEVIEVIQWRRNQNRHRRGRAGRAESVWREQKAEQAGDRWTKIHLSLFFVRKKNPVYFSRNPFYTG